MENDLQQAEREPCEGRICSGSGCSHERAAADLIAHDQAIGLYGEVPTANPPLGAEHEKP